MHALSCEDRESSRAPRLNHALCHVCAHHIVRHGRMSYHVTIIRSVELADRVDTSATGEVNPKLWDRLLVLLACHYR